MRIWVDRGYVEFDIGAMVAFRFDTEGERKDWYTAGEVASLIGLPECNGSATQVGRWATHNGYKAMKSNGRRYLLMPPLLMV